MENEAIVIEEGVEVEEREDGTYARMPIEGFEEDFAKYFKMKDSIREEILAKAEIEIAEKTEKLDKLIDLTSEFVKIQGEIEEVDPEAEETPVEA